MTDYRRIYIPGSTWFFTVNLAKRKGHQLLLDHIENLRGSFIKVRKDHPFKIIAIVVLPDHLHCILSLPEGDSDFSTRWGLIKADFSRGIAKGESLSSSRNKRGERGIWQRRFWDHLIRDENDLYAHLDYIHWNPVKHGLTKNAADWPYSSFQRFVNAGFYPENWCNLNHNFEIDFGE
ncbi:transposase [Methylomonas paludis]|uniref:Transposase n=1 Tax=Methylomonas paludis TaxID=1173101 RepID=A0A975MQM5_9GAMM|nr:transposase [Methylomonas paludis]QWF72253.1 transposase [Methylomonas paludis]